MGATPPQNIVQTEMHCNPLVSVVMIFLNEEKFIQEAIESVFAQTYNNWELLLVDDGSTDKSTAIAHKFSQQYPEKVRYLEHDHRQNQGMSASRNLGISNAKGDYIAFLDADDVWVSDKLKQQVAIMESYPDAALVCGRTQWWYSWTDNPEDSQEDFLQEFDLELDRLVPPPQVLLMFLQNEWASLGDILVRRKSVEDIGGYEEDFRGIYEDQVFHAKLCLKYPVYVSNRCWYRYRQHPGSCTFKSNKEGHYLSARQTFLNWLKEYLVRQDLGHTEVTRFVRKDLWRCRLPVLSRISKVVHGMVK